MPYAYCEQIGKEIRDISDEIPFEIPDSWEWVRCSSLATLLGGYAFKSTQYKDNGIRVIRISDFSEDGLLYNEFKYYDELIELKKLHSLLSFDDFPVIDWKISILFSEGKYSISIRHAVRDKFQKQE